MYTSKVNVQHAANVKGKGKMDSVRVSCVPIPERNNVEVETIITGVGESILFVPFSGFRADSPLSKILQGHTRAKPTTQLLP